MLKSRLKNGTAFDTSYIFAGAFGRGKTTLSRIHARAMLCQDLDTSDPEPCNQCDNCLDILNDQPGAFVERDAASQGTIDHIRAIVDELSYVLENAHKRIYLFDEAHRMSIAAQDVLLKPLEEKRMIGMFCTTEASKIRGAIRSRCEEYTIRKASQEETLKRCQIILEKENVEWQDEAIQIVIDHSGGHIRDVLNKLEMISQLGPISVAHVRDYLHLSAITFYYQILLSLGDPSQSIELIDKACEQVAPDEVASGIAEAAMNTYRVANRMFTDSSLVDKELASQVYNKYGSDVVKFAYWFLDQRSPTKLSLTRDVVMFALNPGNLPLKSPAPPIVISSSVSVPAQIHTSVPPAPAPQALETPSEVTPLVETHQAQEAATEPERKSQPPSSDYVEGEDYTPIEKEYMSGAVSPRMRNSDSVPPSFNKVKPKNMDPREWRGIFERTLKKRRI